MAFICCRRHGIFPDPSLLSILESLSSTRAWLLQTRTFLTSPLRPPSYFRVHSRTVLNDVQNETDLRAFVDKFKKYSKYRWFRTHRHIFFIAARRLAVADQFPLIEEIVEEQKKYTSIYVERFLVKMMRVYEKSGMLDHAVKLFDEMTGRRTAMSCNALLSCSFKMKNFNDVQKIFREVFDKHSINPDLSSYNILLEGHRKMGSLDSGVFVLDEMEKNEVEPDNATFDLILDTLYGNGRFSEAEDAWKLMGKWGISPSTWNYDAKIKALVYQKRMSDAVAAFEELKLKGVKPGLHTFNALITGFCDDGSFDEAKKWYKELILHDCGLNKGTFRRFVPFACDVGNYWYAFKLCNAAASKRCLPDSDTLQRVVDGMVKESWVEKARLFVELVRRFGHELKLPLNDR